jgi:aminopeptidase N
VSITCRDWFQLCLKEGLTVFRDAEFTSDLRSRPVKRIEDVRFLRSSQFAEDSGPLAHPVRPESFIEINNFYTRTVYEKGAELCGMIMTIIGRDNFRKGMDLYFERHDGTAATVEDFIAAMSDASKTDLSQFMLWYSQAGTPELTCRMTYSEDAKSAKLTVKQEQKPTPGQDRKKPLHIPLRLGLISAAGKDLPLVLDDGTKVKDGVLHIRKRSESFTFTKIPERPVASLLRGFSAPVRLDANWNDRDLEFLVAHDSDLFSRWQAAQTLAMKSLVAMTETARHGQAPRPSPRFGKAMGVLIADESLDPAFRAEMLALPSENDIAMAIGGNIDPEAIHTARTQFRASLGRALKEPLQDIYERYEVTGPYSPDAKSVGRRALRNAALSLLSMAGGRYAFPRLREHFKRASNMTDEMAALRLLNEQESPARQAALDSFYRRWKNDALVLDKWFALQASSPVPGTLDRVKELQQHPQFSMTNPNRVRSLIGVFAMGNPKHFHAPDGSGYKLLTDAVLELNGFNPLMAARLLNAFETWRLLEPKRQSAARKALERVRGAENLSRDVFEIASKLLGEAEKAA